MKEYPRQGHRKGLERERDREFETRVPGRDYMASEDQKNVRVKDNGLTEYSSKLTNKKDRVVEILWRI